MLGGHTTWQASGGQRQGCWRKHGQRPGWMPNGWSQWQRNGEPGERHEPCSGQGEGRNVLPPGSSGRRPRGPKRRAGSTASAAARGTCLFFFLFVLCARHKGLCQQHRCGLGAALSRAETKVTSTASCAAPHSAGPIGNDFDSPPLVEALDVNVEVPHRRIAGDCGADFAVHELRLALDGWCEGGATPSEGTTPGGPRRPQMGGVLSFTVSSGWLRLQRLCTRWGRKALLCQVWRSGLQGAEALSGHAGEPRRARSAAPKLLTLGCGGR